jgi:hypothetical protein
MTSVLPLLVVLAQATPPRQPAPPLPKGTVPAPSAPAPTVPAPDTASPPVDAPTVSASASSQQVALGQVFYLFVRVVYEPGTQVNLPASLPLGPAFEETGRTDNIEKNKDGTLTRDYEIALQAFEVGDLVIPPIPVTYAAQGRAQEVATQAVPVQVTSTIGDREATLRDIRGPVAVERPDYTLIWVAAVFTGALVLVVALLMLRGVFRRRRRRVLARLPEALVRSAHDEALARLAEVEGSGALDDRDRKPAYLAMSEIIRTYIGRRWGFSALDLTTEEIRQNLVSRPGGGAAADLVCGWLETTDFVKYARYDASPEEARQALYEARMFIERTRAPAPPPPGAPPGPPQSRAVP